MLWRGYTPIAILWTFEKEGILRLKLRVRVVIDTQISSFVIKYLRENEKIYEILLGFLLGAQIEYICGLKISWH